MSMLSVFGLMFLVILLAVGIDASAQSKPDRCPEQLQQIQSALKDSTITESLLEQEVNQKRKQVSSLGQQLQEERQAHAATKKQLAQFKKAAEK